MENKESTFTMKEAWKRNARAWKIWNGLCPRVFSSKFLSSMLKAISPYVTIYFSARIIGELAGDKNSGELLKWILLELFCFAGIAFLHSILKRWSDYEMDNAYNMNTRPYMEKMLSLDYSDIDRQYVFDLYSQIMQNQQYTGWGIVKTLDIFESAVTSLIQILGGIVLSFSLFIRKVPDGSDLEFLNKPVCIAAIHMLMLLIAAIAPMCTNQSGRYWSKWAPEARFGNRCFMFYGFMSSDRKRAADLRMYQQQEKVCKVYLNRNTLFGIKSGISRYARGPMGLWAALGQSLSVLLIGVVYLFVCMKAAGGAFGIGSVTQYVGAITQLFLGISALLEVAGNMRENGEFLKLCYEFLDLPNKMYQGSLTTEKRADRQYCVEFRDVSFQYPGSKIWVLRHINMKFKVGSRLAVVGRNGSGKTTFIKLLCRLYDPTEGQILLNGIDIRKYKYDDYINLFSVVFQDFKLLSLPIAENVAGAAAYDKSRVLECLKMAGFEEKLNAMPRGTETYLYKDLDENGVEISGGEAQKIAIARALYKDAPFMILDEPTAALDPIAEAEIYSKFNAIAGDKTAVYISHRLSSCRFCDEIAVFEQGHIVQQGAHEELLAEKDGKYAELWHAQAEYYE